MAIRTKNFIRDIFGGKYDKSTHFALSFLLTAVALLYASVPLALIGVFGLGLAKEIVDAFTPGKRFDVWDLSVNILGIISAYVLFEALVIAFR